MSLKVYRHEFKYIINKSELQLIRTALLPYMKQDPNMTNPNGYWIRSLYFDTYQNTDYYDKENGLPARKKIRLRIYDEKSNKVKFEIKNKVNQYLLKETMTISKSHSTNIINGHYFDLLGYKQTVGNKIFYEAKTNFLRPVTIVDYEREAYYLPYENIRLTIDKDIRASTNVSEFFNKKINMIPIFEDDIYVFEIKYNHMLPSFIQHILSTCQFQKQSVSKYVLARQKLG